MDICLQCGGPIPEERRRYHAKYCSSHCSNLKNGKRYRYLNPKPIFSTDTVGLISEHRVVIDLLSKGYEVFRAVSHACSCDLAILKNGHLLRVEVRTGRYTSTGKIWHNQKGFKADVLATVMPEEIIYEPTL